jgi:hypothetical protein
LTYWKLFLAFALPGFFLSTTRESLVKYPAVWSNNDEIRTLKWNKTTSRQLHSLLAWMQFWFPILLLPDLRYGRSPGSQFCKALLIPRRTAPTCPAFEEKKLTMEECLIKWMRCHQSTMYSVHNSKPTYAMDREVVLCKVQLKVQGIQHWN